MKREMKIFSGSSNRELALEIAKEAGVKLGEIDLSQFSDGEKSVKIKENVRGADVFIVQSTGYPANDNIIELLLIIDALQRASASRITVVIPYYGYGRQDRKVEPRVPISAKVIAKIIENTGADRILSMDLHADQIQGFFDIPVDHLFSAPVIVDYFKNQNITDLMMVSPDSGGAERARFFGKQLNAEMAIIDKRREKANSSEIMHLVGNVKDKNCVLIDDMIDTAGTICNAAHALKEHGAKNIFAAATHGVMSGPAIERMSKAPFAEIIITNTMFVPAEKKLPNMKILSVANLIGEAIIRIHEEKSVSSLFI
ncbi:MAG: ribose-phosphate pyrophosphokinase [Spirochaetia bacterium]|nr:ribose-phosphate pyrophosphokinase [Spirochaetia bacterium]